MKRIRVILVFLAALTFLGLSYYFINDTEDTKFKNSFSTDYLKIRGFTKESSEYTNLIRMYSNEFLNKVSTENEKFDISYLKYNPISKSFNSDKLKTMGLEMSKGNITGIGQINANPLKLREIYLAEKLNPYFTEVFKSSPDITWIYYTSLNGFNNLYPFVPSEEFAFSNDLLKEQSTVLGTVENNKSRSVYWSNPYLDNAGKGMMLTVTSPVDYGSTYVGSISIDLTVKYLSKELNNHYTSILCDGNGNIITTSKSELLSTKKINNIKSVFKVNSNAIFNKIKQLPNSKIEKINGYEIIKNEVPGTNWSFYYLLTPSDKVFMYGKKIIPILFITILLICIAWFGEKRKDAEEKLTITVFDLENKKKELEEISIKDPLTGALNRRGIESRITTEINKSQMKEKGISFILFDIDSFKMINDKHGHSIGDFILSESAKLITKNIRENDYFSRWGGEEFLIVTTNTSYEKSIQNAEALRQKIEEYEFSLGINKINVTMTFGVSMYDPSKEVFQSIEKADKAMYFGKNKGKNLVIGEQDIDCD